MNLATQVISERGKAVQKTGNEYLIFDLTVNRESIGQVELYYNDDRKYHTTHDEWVLSYKPDGADEWEIVTQGNIERK